jgi:hypothetical protein
MIAKNEFDAVNNQQSVFISGLNLNENTQRDEMSRHYC